MGGAQPLVLLDEVGAPDVVHLGEEEHHLLLVPAHQDRHVVEARLGHGVKGVGDEGPSSDPQEGLGGPRGEGQHSRAIPCCKHKDLH